MALVVQVPLNTVLADLDEGLRTLLRRELERHGFEGVEIAFDAPSSDWSGQLTGPAVNLFLYDLRQAAEGSEMTPSETRGNGAAVVAPPLRLEITYAITAWTQAVEDEHRLLSQVLAILFSHRNLPDDVLGDRLSGGAQPQGVEGAIAGPATEKADFWPSVGGRFKASLDYMVRLTIESGAVFTRGPEVRTQTMITREHGGRPGTRVELHRFGGTLRDKEGSPAADAWVAIPDAGRWTSSDADGRFIFERLTTGKHHVVVRTLAGETVEADIEVPGTRADLVVGKPKGKGAKE
jgi:Pvc16 N-terminal domain